MKNNSPSAIVVGAGIGGLATAIRLSNLGFKVTVFEAANTPGGKIAQLKKDGFRWDMGPSLFTLPHLVDELFTQSGKSPNDYYNYSQLDVITKYFFPDKTIFSAAQSLEKLKEDLVSIFGESREKVNAFFGDVKDTYDFTEPLFLKNPIKDFPKNLSGSLWSNIKHFLRMNAFSSMHKTNHKYFSNPKTIQIFNRYATYNGSDPYRAPGTLNVIAHLEHSLGAYFLKGGMYQLTKSVYQLALDLGVEFHFNQKVEKIMIEAKQAKGVIANGKQFYSDVVVSNADIMHAYNELMPNVKKPSLYLNQEKSTSALVFYWGVNKQFPQLDLHNIFFSSEYEKEFQFLRDGKVFNDPTVYLYVSSKFNKEDAPLEAENWFVMINVPSNKNQDWNTFIQEAKNNIIQKLSKDLGEDFSKNIVTESILSPLDIEKRTTSYGGALYGNSSNNMFSAFLRHPNKRNAIKNLYFVSGSGHPGGGIPLCILSSNIATQHITHDKIIP